MLPHAPILDWVDAQQADMTRRVIEWAGVNSGSHHLAGLARMISALRKELSAIGASVSEVALAPDRSVDATGAIIDSPLSNALVATMRPEASLRVFLCIHMDTVFGVDHPFQSCKKTAENTLVGPGVVDAKGGLVVMLTALAALERSPAAAGIGWEVLINPDEEIGSPGSSPLLAEAARRNHLGLLFEPAMADGSMVGRRSGSGNFSVVVRGRSAHAGRDFAHGRNAVVAAAELASALHALNAKLPGVTLNVGRIDGGGPVNVVPDVAVCRFNVRVLEPGDQTDAMRDVGRLVEQVVNRRDGLSAELHGAFTSPPKAPDERGRVLMGLIEQCGRDLGVPVQWKHSGGVCDGNKLAAAGLPNVDTLGPRGGGLHSPQEFLLLDSLAERAKLTALLLLRLASGEMVWK